MTEHNLPVVAVVDMGNPITVDMQNCTTAEQISMQTYKEAIQSVRGLRERIAELESVVKQSKRALCASANVCSGESLSKSALIRALELSRDALKSIESLGIMP